MIEPAAWKFLIASVLIHVLYYTFLLKAYSYGDLSHTYPIARGLGPLLVALVSGRFIGEELRTQDIVGVFLLSFGLVALAMPLRNVVPRPGAQVEGGAIAAALKSRIANFKVPKQVFVVADLPRNAMGKVLKNALRDQHKALFGG